MPKRSRTPSRSGGPPDYRVVRARSYPTPARSMRFTSNMADPGRVARNLAETAFNRFAPFPLRAAVGVGRLAYNAIRRSRSGRRTGSKTMSGPKYFTTGKYGGKFAKKFKRTKKNNYREKGFVHTAEIHGTISDPDCTYIGQSSYSGYQILEIICQCLLKKLFAKTGFICKDVTQTLPYFSDGNVSNLWRIRFVRLNREDGSLDNQDYTTSSNVSIYTLVGDKSTGTAPLWPGFVNSMLAFMTGEYASGTSALNVQEPYRLELYREEGNVGVFYQAEAAIELTMEQIHIYSKSDLKVQNRTLAADNSTDATDVSNNPIIGYEYRFSSGSPRCKDGTSGHLSSVLEPSGIITARSAQMSSAFKEPPPANAFWNCTSSARVKLDPGQIKKSSLWHSSKMPLLAFMKKCNFSVGTNLKQISLFGKSSLLALEDIINVNAANNISIAYEINREFGAYLTTHYKNSSLGVRYDMTVNNNP